ncbi:uncharacterized protein LOC117299471 [Asterias rubens]|uniref:uncharacterized protein LOC117299471 n=1 Tax=Asterias rubens TaxID=7604 RepID=UPI001455945B|nr:uncharacterized protein LOC117299471 [Asterias rubens]
MMMEDALRETPRRWSCYRNCTNYMSLCNLIFGLLLISLWVACFERCLSRMSIENDAAAPLWTGIVCVIVGSFGLVFSCLYWKRKNETLLFVLILITALCSSAALTLSVYASFKEFQLYESEGRPLDVFDYGILGVALFAAMALFSFIVFIGSVTWACMCAFRRHRSKVLQDEKIYIDADGDIHIEDEEPPAFVRAFQTASLPRPSRLSTSATIHPLQQATSYDRRHSNYPQSNRVSFNLPKYGSWDSRRDTPRYPTAGPRFASVTAADRQWWRYCNPDERTRRVSGL